ncbi:MAG: DUF47 family protein [Prevotellaceae bacterium]|jgi:predicted phosphate transport protein (TIGR00153 family)|nr:DUF47 family protein [Prevotellaceae bacterium]
MLNTFFNKFLPKESKFFPLLKEVSGIMLNVTDLIIECVSSKDHKSAVECFKKIKEQERNADKVANCIFDALNTTFITPFDREDINHLANRMDDVIDNITSCAKRIALYNPKQIPEAAIGLARNLKESAEYICKAVDELDILKKNTDNIKTYCVELHNLENRADDIYEHFLMDLFENETDGIEITKVKEIMYELEKATDTAEHVGKIIKTIIVKYA